MAQSTVKLIIDSSRNSLTFSKNFRIFSTSEPVKGILQLTAFVEDLMFTSPNTLDLINLTRKFRYSRNKSDWSLWYTISPSDLGIVDDIDFDKDERYYFEIRYEYDDGTMLELDTTIEINEIKLRFKNASTIPNTILPTVTCSDEKCTSIIATGDPSFRPYDVDSAIGVFNELSFYTNVMFGHEVLWFRTVPDASSGDYIFKEWTIFKNIDRKCVKVAVPKNAFPSNMPKYKGFGHDFELPFEIHVDHRYFQSIFGMKSEPRKRDFLYFPLVNRMFEVQGSYIHRGFMMSPTFWKIQLKKFNPNIDMLLTDESRTFLDNVIQSSESLFGGEVEDAVKDGTMPQQYATISTSYDNARRAMHPELSLKPLRYTYNFASLIENYYDLVRIPAETQSFKLTSDAPPLAESMNLVTLQSLDDTLTVENAVILAYQNSDAYKTWRNGAILSGDKNTDEATTTNYIRVRGPFDTLPDHIGQTESGRYIRLEAYKGLDYKTQRDIVTTDVSGDTYATFYTGQTAVIYEANPLMDSDNNQNLTFTCLFNVPSDGKVIKFIDGYDAETNKGFKVEALFSPYTLAGIEGDLTITTTLNSNVITKVIPDFKTDIWYAVIVAASNEFKQIGKYVYEITDDPTDIINHSGMDQQLSSIGSLPSTEFNLSDSFYRLPASNVKVSNIRLFNTMLKEDQHDFILSQQYIKDESMLIIIDNCKPQLNVPFIAKNK